MYSNMNYAIIASMIEACWGGPLHDFMQVTLFTPLGLHSTSIGLAPQRTTPSMRWTADQHGTSRPVQVPDYSATGAEAAALGAYSTSEDLDKFFSSLINATHDIQPEAMEGLNKTIYILLGIENKWVDGIMHYTPFGLETTLGASIVGSLSTSGMQFPTERFTEYPAVPGTLGEGISFHYMAGSAIGCSCATAFRVDTDQDFALTVLTDTTGPVPAADHILRLVLRKYVDSHISGPVRHISSITRHGVHKMVKEAKTHATKNWTEKADKEGRLRRMAFPEPFDIQGTYNGIEIPHQLNVTRSLDGKLFLTMSGVPSVPRQAAPTSGAFELLWQDDAHVWMCVPPHLSVDRLDEGDWSHVLFTVVRDAAGDVELRRQSKVEVECHFKRQL